MPKIVGLMVIVSVYFVAVQQAHSELPNLKPTVRFYKVNKQLQADRLLVSNRAAAKPGCHNFIKKVRLHRLVQVGYQHCSVYTKKKCDPDTLVTAVTEKGKTAISKLTPGKSWFFDAQHPRGIRVKSWYCE